MKWLRLSLLWKIWLSTAASLMLLFGVAGYFLQRHLLNATTATLREEVGASFQAYESLWRSRSETLAAVAAIMSSMPNVRAAFQTRHRPTIQDAAGELWDKVSDQIKETAFFAVAAPNGDTLAALDSQTPVAPPRNWPVIRVVRDKFPKQASGFTLMNDQLYQIVLTPVYVDGQAGQQQLMSVLVTGYVVNHLVAQRLKESTGGSEFLFVSGGRVFASTLNDRATAALQANIAGLSPGELVHDGVSEYATLRRDLIGPQGEPAGALWVFRSFDSARQSVLSLQRTLIAIFAGALLAGLGITYFLARRIIRPVRLLDRAASQVAQQNYDLALPDLGQDEVGRLAQSFNSMCHSLRLAQQELIRQERISTIGRMASSIVHDLRNPLAAIYGGAEMMVDTELTPPQVKRVASNIYRSSRRIQEMLQDLLHITRGKSGAKELCRLPEVIEAAVEASRPAADTQKVAIHIEHAPDIELPLERSRIERVFQNLIGNALEVMPNGGEIHIRTVERADSVEIEVSDTGPGIAPEIRARLFQPFASHGKRNGLGLGLALSRQSVLDHGGDLWAAESSSGARFWLRLPKQAVEQLAAA